MQIEKRKKTVTMERIIFLCRSIRRIEVHSAHPLDFLLQVEICGLIGRMF